jgi:hypothetical protein
MQQEQQNRSSRKIGMNYRSLGELIRGIFFVLFGLYACFAEKLGIGNFAISQIYLNILGIVLIAYGLFRVYRGVKNTFFNQD